MLCRPRPLHHLPTHISLYPPHLRHTRTWHSPSAPSLHRSPPQNHYRRRHDPSHSQRCRVFFSTTPLHRQHQEQPQNHYEVLGVDPSITPPELKKRFYALSRSHHPDLHPSDPTAVQRFQQISESYSTLADPSKRARYDRDVMRTSRHAGAHQQQQQQQQRGGTYAGSRAPTGLSKRQSAFRGPPPSYFRQGGGGSYDPHVNPHARGATAGEATGANAGAGARGGGVWGDPNEFDSRGVHRTQSHEDRKRNARRARAMAQAQALAEEDGDFWARFVIVSCVLLAGITIASLVVNASSSGKNAGGMVRADGSRREKKAP
ncbi:uncharacterized protein HMPREF1541_00813 [Cyphellophora europaea CBS 101466]|uniref:J domain-containing protein n=1 Tax=Cyphellophora europaea (strain CBS 101466) TaxID=1220924 RepID=W2SD42_CYPE1|nr:uncharacterized protein HMPREF1541_00813 [Cyphellophora europaea CBS 101466]ETN46627.1 hypothetical protein HMPREF1541_00813 [Cyphellophora europaea CBS 101466]